MSERSRVQHALWQASNVIDGASETLDAARSYVESYDFLKDANPALLGDLGQAIDALTVLRDKLWNTEVKTA